MDGTIPVADALAFTCAVLAFLTLILSMATGIFFSRLGMIPGFGGASVAVAGGIMAANPWGWVLFSLLAAFNLFIAAASFASGN